MELDNQPECDAVCDKCGQPGYMMDEQCNQYVPTQHAERRRPGPKWYRCPGKMVPIEQ